MSKAKPADIITAGIEAVSRSLVEFGYPDATPELIRKYYETWKAGKESEDIIFAFAAAQFNEHTMIFGRPA